MFLARLANMVASSGDASLKRTMCVIVSEVIGPAECGAGADDTISAAKTPSAGTIALVRDSLLSSIHRALEVAQLTAADAGGYYNGDSASCVHELD